MIDIWHVLVEVLAFRGVAISTDCLSRAARDLHFFVTYSLGSVIHMFTYNPGYADHYNEWIAACRGEGTALCNFDYSGTLIEHNLLGNVAHRADKALKWDAKNFKFTNDQSANKLLTKDYRKGWEIKI